MAKKRYIPKSKHDSGKHLVLQKLGMKKYFPCFECTYLQRTLKCVGSITPSKDCDTYTVQITLRVGMVPHVTILDPIIEPSNKYHMYSSGELCLFKPKDQPWMNTDFLHKKIVPWTAEWLVYYELYKMTGEWHGPEAPHGDGGKETQKKAG